MIRELPVLSRCRRRENHFIASITIAAVCFFIGPFTVKRRRFAFHRVEIVSLFRPFSTVIEPRLWGETSGNIQTERDFPSRYLSDSSFRRPVNRGAQRGSRNERFG